MIRLDLKSNENTFDKVINMICPSYDNNPLTMMKASSKTCPTQMCIFYFLSQVLQIIQDFLSALKQVCLNNLAIYGSAKLFIFHCIMMRPS